MPIGRQSEITQEPNTIYCFATQLAPLANFWSLTHVIERSCLFASELSQVSQEIWSTETTQFNYIINLDRVSVFKSFYEKWEKLYGTETLCLALVCAWCPFLELHQFSKNSFIFCLTALLSSLGRVFIYSGSLCALEFMLCFLKSPAKK